MAVIETWLTQDLQEPVQVQHLCGSFFSHNGNANRIGVKVFNNGSAASLSGTVSGYAVIEDGTTVPCTGSLSGNQASVLLPAAAYVPGNVCVTIMLTSGTTVTTLAALVATVVEARTDTQVDPGSVVTDWTNTINAALQTVENYTGNIIATPYASLTYPVPLGKYCIYNNLLYRCVTPISSSESWTSSHWVQTKLADDVSDLKSALRNGDKGITDYLYTTAMGNTRKNMSYESVTLPAKTTGAISGEIGAEPTFNNSSNYARYLFDCTTIKDWIISTYQSTSASYPYYVYMLDSTGIIISADAPKPTSASENEYTIQCPYTAVQMYVLVNAPSSHEPTVRKGVYTDLFTRMGNGLQDKTGEIEYVNNTNIGDIYYYTKYVPINNINWLNGGIIGNVGDENITITATSSYSYCKLDATSCKHFSTRISQSASANYPKYVIATDFEGNVVYTGAEPGSAARIEGFDIELPITAVWMYVLNSGTTAYSTVSTISYETVAERIQHLENNPSAFSTLIPASAKAVSLLNKQHRFLNMAVITDTHVKEESYLFHCMKNIALFCDISMRADVGVHLGDITEATDNNLQTTAYNQIVAKRAFDLARCPMYFVRGNHDLNARYNENTSWDELQDKTNIDLNEEVSPFAFNSVYQQQYTTGDIVTNPLAPYENYFYHDFEEYKIRIVLLCDYVGSTYDENQLIGETQAKWFAENALNLSDKENPTSWVVILCKHTSTVTTGGANLPNDRLKDIIRDFMEGKDTHTSYNTNYSTQGAIPLIMLHGNNHEDQYTNGDGFSNIGIDQSFSTQADGRGINNEYCCDIWTIDTVNHIAYETRFGRGESRKFAYGTLGTANNYMIQDE